jgi:hypothetical protein
VTALKELIKFGRSTISLGLWLHRGQAMHPLQIALSLLLPALGFQHGCIGLPQALKISHLLWG